MANNPNISLRLSPTLVLEADTALKDMGMTRTDFFRMCLEALVEQRLVLSYTPNQHINAGTHQDYPVLVCFTPTGGNHESRTNSK